MLTIPIRQQDGSIYAMPVADTVTNRLFAAWVQSHEAFSKERKA